MLLSITYIFFYLFILHSWNSLLKFQLTISVFNYLYSAVQTIYKIFSSDIFLKALCDSFKFDSYFLMLSCSVSFKPFHIFSHLNIFILY